MRYLKYLKEYKARVIIGPICKWIEAVFELLIPIIMANIIDVGIKNGDTSYVIKMGILMVVLGALGYGFALVCQHSGSIASQGFGTNLRNDFYKHINTLSFKEIDKIGGESLLNRLTNDINQMQQAVAMIIRLVVRSPFLVLGATVLCIIINPLIGGIVAVSAILLGLTLYIIMRLNVKYYDKNQIYLDKAGQITSENLEGARVVRAFSTQQKEKERMFALTKSMNENSQKIGRISAYLNPLTYAIVNLFVVVIIYISGYKVFDGALKQGEVVALLNYMTQILNATIMLSFLASIFSKAYASLKRLNEVFALQSSICEKENDFAIPDFSLDAVNIKQVNFSYSGDGKYVLKDINLTIPQNSTLGIIGGTGSGKSSLINLLPRFYDIDSGEILIFGKNIKDYKLADLRFLFGIDAQYDKLFAGTVKSNLLWGNKSASDEDMLSALKIADAYDFVMKKNGLDTPVLENGNNFSGGQKQRLSIARAVVGNPKILILDDSTSALDLATDKRVRKNISKLQNLTTIIISQRASSLMSCDNIIVLQDGKIVGNGKHDKLYNSCDLYKEICDSQGGNK